MTPQNAPIPLRIRLSLSPEASDAVYQGCIQSYQQGVQAFHDGLKRRKSSAKAHVFDHSSWLLGWDDAKAATPGGAHLAPQGQGAPPGVAP